MPQKRRYLWAILLFSSGLLAGAGAGIMLDAPEPVVAEMVEIPPSEAEFVLMLPETPQDASCEPCPACPACAACDEPVAYEARTNDLRVCAGDHCTPQLRVCAGSSCMGGE